MDLGEPSVPGPPVMTDTIVLGSKGVDDTQPNVVTCMAGARSAGARSAGAPSAPLPEIRYEPELAFDYEVVKTAEAYSEYSTLEREQPGIVAKLTSAWGTPEAAVRLEHYILTPRRGGKALSRDAMAELKLLQTLALDPAYSDASPQPGDDASGRA